jgi:UDP-2,3-diacylglucosamine hydrolase
MEPTTRPYPKNLAIIAGQGVLPLRVAQAARDNGCNVVVYPMVGIALAEDFKAFTVVPFVLGRLGFLLQDLRRKGISDLVLIGALVRPDIASLRPDWGLIKNLFQLFKVMRGGDDNVLKGVVRFLERQGFRVWGAAELAPYLTMQADVLTKHRPDAATQADIQYGMELLSAMSPFDLGQAVIVAQGRAIAVEAVEGTNRMIERVAELKRTGRLKLADGRGVLVKMPKQGQDLRVDMPTIGPDTVRFVKEAGLAGIAIKAGEVLVAERDEVIRFANEFKVFVVGVGAKHT